MKKILFIALFALPTMTFAQRLASYNVRNGIGMDNVKNYDRTSQVINGFDAEVVAIQELDSITGRSGKVDVLGELAKRTNMHPSYARAIAYDGGAYGIGILSRVKPLNVKRYALPGREEARALLVAEFEGYYFFATHFSLTGDDQLSSLRIIDSLAKECKKTVFVAGDFNFTPDSQQYKLLTSFGFNALTPLTGGSYPADIPRDNIDYIVTNAKGVKVLRSEVVVAPIESDHRPILVDLKTKGIKR